MHKNGLDHQQPNFKIIPLIQQGNIATHQLYQTQVRIPTVRSHAVIKASFRSEELSLQDIFIFDFYSQKYPYLDKGVGLEE